VLARIGNRSRWGRFQGLFAAGGTGTDTWKWVAVSADTDEEWSGLVAELAVDGVVLAVGEDESVVFERWARGRDAGEVEARLRERGVPAAAIVEPSALLTHEQLAGRHFYTELDHPVCGTVLYPSLPFVVTTVTGREIPSGHTRPAPTWGQHHEEVLASLLGMGADRRAALERDGVLGTIDPALAPM
jgi:crotonobetainyl-CoA:carnitine CoA-transferase CaiB-like acyl-CoA transferase